MEQETINNKIKRAQEEIDLAEKCMSELKQRKQELQELVESLKAMEAEQNSRAKHGGIYWYIDDIGQIVSVTECNTLSDNYRHEIGNYYLTPEDAEMAEKRIKLFRLLDRFSRQNGWTNELWKSKESSKFFIYFNHLYDQAIIGDKCYTANVSGVDFVSEAVAQQAVNKYYDLIMEVMGI